MDVGGVLTGEHGVGIEKRDLMTYQFGPTDLEVQHRIKRVFDPQLRFNPGKVFPTLSRCSEQGREHVHAQAVPPATPACRGSRWPSARATRPSWWSCCALPGPAFELVAGGSKRGIGRPTDASILDLSALSGIVDYQPGELVLTARPATALAEIESLLAAQRQRLAFEPPAVDAYSASPREQTLGGVSWPTVPAPAE